MVDVIALRACSFEVPLHPVAPYVDLGRDSRFGQKQTFATQNDMSALPGSCHFRRPLRSASAGR